MRPNLVFGPMASGHVPDDSRESYYHWQHVACSNEAISGVLGRWRTRDFPDVELFIEVLRHGHGSIWNDRAAVVGGPESPGYRHSFRVGDDAVHIPLFINATHAMDDPLLHGQRLHAGFYMTGKRFISFAQRSSSEQLSGGKYTVQIHVGPGVKKEAIWGFEFNVPDGGGEGR